MGRKGSFLVPFLKMGLEQGLYEPYLKYVDEKNKDVIRISLPRKSCKIDSAVIQLLKDWCNTKKREYVDYTKAKSALIAALRKSDYLEHIADSNFPLTYRILNSDEVQGKKLLKKQMNYSSPLSVDSGYNSYSESPYPIYEKEMSPCSPHDVLPNEQNIVKLDEQNVLSLNDEWIEKRKSKYNDGHHLLPAIMHDHWFGSYNEIINEQVNYDTQNLDIIGKLSGNFLVDFPLTDSQWKKHLDYLLEDYDINFDMPIPNSEEKKQLDDLEKGVVPSDFDMEDIGVDSANKKDAVLAYKYKEETVIKENLIMMTFESMDKEMNEKEFCGRKLLLDLDLLNRFQAYELINNVCVGHYWQFFFKPLKDGAN